MRPKHIDILLALLLPLLLLLLLGACADDTSAPADAPPANNAAEVNNASDDGAAPPCVPSRAAWDAEVGAQVEAACGRCHGETPRFGAPQSLLDYDALVAGEPGARLSDRALVRLLDDSMPPVGAPRPMEHDAQTLVDWASCGEQAYAPSVDGLRVSAPVFEAPDSAPADLDTFDLLADGFEVGSDAVDLYQCFVVDVPEGDDRFIRRIEAVIDDSRVLHHIVLLRDVERNTPAAPHPCIGMPRDSEYLYAWAPGTGAIAFEDGGLRLKAGERLVLQIHYNNGAGYDDVRDASGVRLYLGPTEGAEYGMVSPGPLVFSVPPGEERVAEGSCETSEPFQILAGMPHMHEAGRAFHQEIVRADGTTESLIDLTGWDFESQLFYATPKTLEVGDRIVTRCVFHNAGTEWVRAGTDTADEMCFNFMYVTPPPATRFCDDVTTEEDITYAPGACFSDASDLSDGVRGWLEGEAPPLVQGAPRVGEFVTLDGGALRDGFYLLDDFWLRMTDTAFPVGDIDTANSSALTRGWLEVRDGTLSMDVVRDIFVVLDGGTTIPLTGERAQVRGAYEIDGGLVAVDSACEGGESVSFGFATDGDRLELTNTYELVGRDLQRHYAFTYIGPAP